MSESKDPLADPSMVASICKVDEAPIDPNRKRITEEMGVHTEWYETARNMTPDKLDTFLKHLMDDYHHDYGTICHALAAGGVATMWAMNKHPEGGITGFQASAIMWEVVQHWMSYKGPLRLVQFDHMLYPQYAEIFDRTITKYTWEYLQKTAKEQLEQKDGHACKDVVAHWQSIVDGKVPFGYTVVDN